MMQEDITELLELTKENNKLLRKMRRHAIFGNVTRLIYWAIIFGGPVLLYYYFIQPQIGGLVDTYDTVKGGTDGLGGLLEKIGIGR